MFYGDTIQDTRQMFFTSWEKYREKKPLLPLEDQIVQVILAHPEYHKLLENYKKYPHQNYFPETGETNPFLHMGLHLGIREQVTTDRPIGIHAIYQRLVQKYADPLTVEHLMMEQLAEYLWHAQKNNLPPDEQDYLHALTNL
ncbi:MAG: DUF1841 family protein [Legionella sp.]|uniref:DUF1841 family protein n=1 Tax=Legionella sp. TaxID=459 RepID=UPI0039E717A3